MTFTARPPILLALAFIALHVLESGAVNSEDSILLALKDSIENWDEVAASRGFQGWSACQPNNCVPVCSWTGIECSPWGSPAGDRVTKLDLCCINCQVPAVGRLLPELADLQFLQNLDLHGNLFYGELPEEWGVEGTFPALARLNLNTNNLTGTLPEQWGIGPAFLSLTELYMSDNGFTGTFPTSWAMTNTSMISLLAWTLAQNQLTGTLPQEINGIITMSLVSFHSNRFTGTLPPLWGRQGYYYNDEYNSTQELRELYLHNNLLTGTLPPEWSAPDSFTALETLTLGCNPLATTLPPSWGEVGSWPRLKTLNLTTTNLTGTLPASWGQGWPSLRTLALDSNNLSGSIPPSWASLPSLSSLFIQPANPQLCTAPPPDAPFQLCVAGDPLCNQPPQPSQNASCQDQPLPPSGGGVPAAAIAVPVSVGGVALLLGVGALVVWRKRRGQRQMKGGTPPPRPADQPLPEGGSFFSPQAENAFKAQEEFELSHFPPDYPPMYITVTKPYSNGASSSPMDSGTPPLQPPPPLGQTASGVSSGWTHMRMLPGYVERSAMEQGSDKMSLSGGPSSSGRQPPSHPHNTSGVSSGGRSGEKEGSSLPPNSPIHPSILAEAARFQRTSPQPSYAYRYQQESLVPHDVRSSYDVRKEFESYVAAFVSDWEIPPHEIEILRRPDGSLWKLGAGGFGKVYKALRNGVQPVAVKVLTTGGDVPLTEEQDFRKEIALLRACRDTNIVQFQGVCVQPDVGTMLVTEYMEGGNLFANIRQGKVSWYRRGKRIAMEVARGLAYLHSRRIVHFDIKSANVLLTREGIAKVGDVGMSKIMEKDTGVTGAVGTLAWSAPEMLWGQKCTTKADIYAFGIVLWEICCGEQPVRGRLRDVRVPEECPEEVRAAILLCLEPHPAARPTAVQLVDMLSRAPAAPASKAISMESRGHESATPSKATVGSAPTPSQLSRVGSGGGASSGGGSAEGVPLAPPHYHHHQQSVQGMLAPGGVQPPQRQPSMPLPSAFGQPLQQQQRGEEDGSESGERPSAASPVQAQHAQQDPASQRAAGPLALQQQPSQGLPSAFGQMQHRQFSMDSGSLQFELQAESSAEGPRSAPLDGPPPAPR